MKKNNISYYAIIPANIRYDKRLSVRAILLYGEITALCNMEGYCWANNKYFSELYGITEISVSRLIGQLRKYKYIDIEYIKRGFEIIKRKIYICDKKKSSINKNVNRSINKNVK